MDLVPKNLPVAFNSPFASEQCERDDTSMEMTMITSDYVNDVGLKSAVVKCGVATSTWSSDKPL